METVTQSRLDLRLPEAELARRRERITGFIADLVEDAGAEGAVLGLSGGIDSTTVAYLAVEALGADRLRGLVMPSTANRPDNMSDAEAVAEELGIEYDVVEIDPIVEAFLEAAPEPIDEADLEEDPLRMAVGNVRVRTRAVLNYFVANHDGRLVLGTGNRTEALTGYYTKYGDQAVDCNPIGNLYKTQVRQLARELGVPERIIEKPPSAGMWAGQTDEEELGLPYGTLDAILALTVDGTVPAPTAADLLDIAVADVERVHDLYERSAHKRAMPPAPEAGE